MKKSYIIVIVLVLVAVGVSILRSKSKTEEDKVINDASTVNMQPSGDTVLPGTQTPAPPVTASNISKTVNFEVSGGSFYFSQNTMKVKKGDTVVIHFKNNDGFHDLKIDEFNVATKKLQSGGEDTVTFVADKIGTFEYYCSVGNHRAMGMKGILTVE